MMMKTTSFNFHENYSLHFLEDAQAYRIKFKLLQPFQAYLPKRPYNIAFTSVSPKHTQFLMRPNVL